MSRANEVFDRYRPSGYKPRSRALFLWSNLDDARWWLENCVLVNKGIAKLYIVDLDKPRCECIACDFYPVEKVFEGLYIGESEEELKSYALEYWRSCRPWRGEKLVNTEILCWCEPKQILVGEAKTKKEIDELIEKAKRFVVSRHSL